MTALDQYARLESVGRWRPAPEASWQEVGVAFGSATLTLSDAQGEPLAHWSLPAVRRVNPGGFPALYAPDQEGSEALEVEDDLLVEAIERVGATVARARRQGPRRARLLGLIVTAGLAGALALWLPGAARRQALEVIPASRRSEIGATMLGYLQRDLGVACRDPLGAAALERLRARLLPGEPGQAVVIPGEQPAPLALPGGIVVLPEARVAGAREPAEVAEAILGARVASPEPLGPFLDRLGFLGTLRLLATGEPPAEAVAAEAEALAANPPEPDAQGLDARLAAAGLVRGGPAEGAEAPVLLSDGEWVSLQGICAAEAAG